MIVAVNAGADLGPVAAEGDVLGLDNVRLRLPVARVGSRVLAALLDYVVLGAFVLAWLLVTVTLAGLAGLGTGWTFALLLFGWFGLEHGYFVLQEALFAGQTLGKRAMSLRVVSQDGSMASTGALVARNLLRLFDLIVGVVLIGTDRLARRLGDRVAGTLVVHHRPNDRAVVLGRVPAGWPIDRARLVEAYLRRADELPDDVNILLGHRIELLVRRDDETFFAEVAGDSSLARLRGAFEAEAH